ncbi:MAG: hypothetical protein RMJ36_02525 [Candidatus Calescibacterium sp.]|nr:hypothetical protein [Candidatus Calescibacterium sp.]MDW8132514.1 hypothetical protein [Candidatus Calescibacterium sp.]
MSKQGISIIEHFNNILKYLKNFSEEIENNQNITELKEKYKLDELKKGIETDIEQIQEMLEETLKKREEDENNSEISAEVKNVLLSIHDSAIDIHEHFINIAYSFIEYIETLKKEILEQVREKINSGVIKLEEIKEINKKLEEIINYKEYEA